jgi:molybdate transport system regulatory protein
VKLPCDSRGDRRAVDSGSRLRLRQSGPSLVNLRIEIGDVVRLGPGKVRLLELIARHGSISAAGRAMQMSYRRAWTLIDTLNKAFREPVVATQPGGRADRRAAITPFGHNVIRRYRAMEAAAREAMADDLAALEVDLRDDTALRVLQDPRVA